MLAHIDTLLLNSAQRFCDAFQNITGLTKFRVEKWALIMIVMSLCVQTVTSRDSLFTFVFIPVMLTWGVFAVWCIEREESDFLQNGRITHSVLDVSHFRIGVLLAVALPAALMGLFLADEVSAIVSVSYVVWTYVSPCIPRPPGKSKMREWSEKALAWLNGRLPEPTPA